MLPLETKCCFQDFTKFPIGSRSCVESIDRIIALSPTPCLTQVRPQFLSFSSLPFPHLKVQHKLRRQLLQILHLHEPTPSCSIFPLSGLNRGPRHRLSHKDVHVSTHRLVCRFRYSCAFGGEVRIEEAGQEVGRNRTRRLWLFWLLI